MFITDIIYSTIYITDMLPQQLINIKELINEWF